MHICIFVYIYIYMYLYTLHNGLSERNLSPLRLPLVALLALHPSKLAETHRKKQPTDLNPDRNRFSNP